MTRTRHVNVDSSFIEAVKGMPRGPYCVLAVDPGSRTGVSLVTPGDVNAWVVGGKRLDVLRLAVNTLRLGCAGVYVREAPFTASAQAMQSSRISTASLWSLGYASGIADAMVDGLLRSDVARWSPQAGTWRSGLGLGGGKRDVVNARVHQWAEADLGRHIRTATNAPDLDAANAYAMAKAAISVVEGIRRTQR